MPIQYTKIALSKLKTTVWSRVHRAAYPFNKQSPGQCKDSAMELAKAASGYPQATSFRVISSEVPQPWLVKNALERNPCVFIARGIARSSSAYLEEHAIVLLGMQDDEIVVVADQDNTVGDPDTLLQIRLSDLLAVAWRSQAKPGNPLIGEGYENPDSVLIQPTGE